jgi:hypothetical protein
MLNLYLKYKYQLVFIGLKLVEKEAFLNAINRSLIKHLYALHLLEKVGFCFLCEKKSTIKPFQEKESAQISFQATF